MAAFLVLLASFVFYASLYFATNRKNDRFQLHIVASITLAGFVLALSFGFGPMISAFCVVPRAVIVGLLVSDLTHLMLPVLQYKEDTSLSREADGVSSEKS